MASISFGQHQLINTRTIVRFLPYTASLTALWPRLESLLELFPPWLLAVPKKKTSHSRKRMRSANKGLKDKENIHPCPACGRAKLMHNVCHYCFSDIKRAWLGPRKDLEKGPSPRWWT